MKLKNTALVLEGGGFRGMYSAGILDFFLEKNLEFPYVIGVSMGACNAASFASKQHGRNLAVPHTYINDRRYISYRRLFTKGELFGMKFIFSEVPQKHIIFDYETFQNSKTEVVVVVTDCRTGEAEYFNRFTYPILMEALKASTSLPFVCKMVRIENRLFLDGGIADSIPYKKAFSDGYKKAVVILTQPEDYLKQPVKYTRQVKLFYRKFPELAEKIIKRSEYYNESIAELKQLEAEKKVFIIRPHEKLPIERIERNKNNLKKAYDIGYAQTPEFYKDLIKFCD
ncbi:MAG: patatin family protein [Spirochaetes bacterium]|nr:patatin family protein [Spirochaetota bacterium]